MVLIVSSTPGCFGGTCPHRGPLIRAVGPVQRYVLLLFSFSLALKIETTRYDLHVRGVEITLQIESGPPRPSSQASQASQPASPLGSRHDATLWGHQNPLCQDYLMELSCLDDLDYCIRFNLYLNLLLHEAPRALSIILLWTIAIVRRCLSLLAPDPVGDTTILCIRYILALKAQSGESAAATTSALHASGLKTGVVFPIVYNIRIVTRIECRVPLPRLCPNEPLCFTDAHRVL